MSLRSFISGNINLYEFSYDCALLIFPFLLEKIYDPLIQTAIFGIPFRWFFMMLAVYFLPMLIGRMYHNLFGNSPRPVKKIVIAILFTVTIFAYGNLIYLVMLTGDDITTRGIFAFIASTVLLVMGPIAGLAFNSERSERDSSFLQLLIFLITIGMLPLFYMLITAKEAFGINSGFILFIIVCGLCVLDAALIIGLAAGCMMLRELLVRAGLIDAAVLTWKLIIPFSISFILVFFNIYTDRLFTGSGGIHGAGSIIWLVIMYVFTGVFPLRLIMMFAPPVRLINVVMGLTSAAVMIWLVSLR